jgi:parallel beta-helix repeat protein
MLAVTATLSGGDLLIEYNAPGDLFADIVSNGTEYTVSGTGLAATQYAIGAGGVTGKIVVEDRAGVGGQEFTVRAGDSIRNPVQISINIESSFVSADISTSVAGDVLIGSPTIALAADVDTAGQSGDITFLGDVLLSDNVSVTSGSEAAGGDIRFDGALDGDSVLELTAGTGSVSFLGLVGGVTPLGTLTIQSAVDVDANGIHASSFSQATGSGTTTLNSGDFSGVVEALRTSDASGVSIVSTVLAVNGLVTASGGGGVSFAQSGTLGIASGGDIVADGGVVLTAGAGGIRTAGDVTTSDASVLYMSPVTLTGPVAVSTGAGLGNIFFDGTVDGGSSLELTAGTGAVGFFESVGSIVPVGGLRLNSADSVTATSTITLDGSSLTASFDGLFIGVGVNGVSFSAAGSSIQNFGNDGIVFAGGSVDSTITGFTVVDNGGDGVDVRAGDYGGTSIQGNVFSRNTDGIWIQPFGGMVSNLSIGNLASGNVLSENRVHGFHAGFGDYSNSTLINNTISGNLDGVYLEGEVTNLIVLRNTIDANNVGVAALPGDYAGTLIQANSITSNNLDGIALRAGNTGITNLTIGGAANAIDDWGNLISGNGSDGIEADAGDFTGSLIEGNEIILNSENGIFLNAAGGGLTNLRIGTDFGRNTIGLRSDNRAGNGNLLSGILVSGGDFSGTVIAGNTIGYNQVHGIELEGAESLTVGGPSVTDPNTIVRNTDAGVFATGDSSGTVVRGNLIDRNEFGVRLDEATGILIGGSRSISANTITGNKTAGVEATGLLTGSRLHGNIITGSPTGVALVNARQLAVGGEFQGEGNRINSSTQGLTAQGPSTGTLVRGNVFEGNDVGAALISATGLEIGNGDNTAVFGRNLFDDNSTGLTASGLLFGTIVHGNLIQAGVTGIALDNARQLQVGGPEGKNGNSVQFQTTNGLLATGQLGGTVVSANSFVNNYVGVTLDKAENLYVVSNAMTGSTNTGLSAFGDLSGSVVIGNSFSANASGIVLHDRLGPGIVQNLTVTGNSVDGSRQNGLFVTGDLDGTVVTGNTISNTGTEGNHASAALVNVKNLVFGEIGAGNTVIGGTGAGIYTTGDLSGTVIRSNVFSQTRAAVVLEDTRNATVGGLAEGEGNSIFGGGDVAQAQYRDGIFALGDLAGSSVSGTQISDAWIGVSLNATRNLVVENNTITDSQGIGLFAAGDQSGTSLTTLEISRSTPPPRQTSGAVLSGATGLTLASSSFSGDTTALFVFNDSTGTSILGNTFFGQISGVGLFNVANLAFGSGGVGNVVGGGQTGLYAAGSLPGTVVSDGTFSASGPVGTGMALVGAQNLTVRSSTFQGSNVGIYGAGGNLGTAVFASLVDGNTYGVSLQGARGMVFGGTGLGNTISNSSKIGLSTTGDCTGSAVLDTVWAANAKNVVNKARGLTIQPTPPKP